MSDKELRELAVRVCVSVRDLDNGCDARAVAHDLRYAVSRLFDAAAYIEEAKHWSPTR